MCGSIFSCYGKAVFVVVSWLLTCIKFCELPLFVDSPLCYLPSPFAWALDPSARDLPLFRQRLRNCRGSFQTSRRAVELFADMGAVQMAYS